MDVTLFDGTAATPCTVEQAQAAANQPGLAWIDVRLAGGDDTEATAVLQAVGMDASAVQAALQQGLATDFTITPESVTGVCWVDDVDGSPAQQVCFAWNQMRLVTVRRGGDAAIAQVRQRVTERVDVLRKDPSTLLGVTLQLMLASVQRGLTQTMIGVGSLDLEIIATSKPSTDQSQRLNAFRSVFQPLALRFPMYLVNVQAALIDPDTVPGMTPAGLSQLQQFQSAAQSTGGLIDTLVSAVRNAAQDLQGQVSNWQSDRINVLTIVTMIFLPISFLTGYFGMNFTWLDNQLNSFASWFLLGVALPVGLVVGSVVLLASSGYTVPRLLRRHRPKNPG